MAGKAYVVYGAGISGRGAVEVLARRGEQVFLYNDNPCSVDEALIAAMEKNGGGLVVGKENYPELIAKAGTLVLSPGIPCDIPTVMMAEEQGLEVIAEVEFGYRIYGGHIAGITGTNGKTTTTTLVGTMLKRLPVPSAIGGNIGLALSKEVENLPKEGWLAAELSSFQLEKVKTFAPDVALMLNLTPDHMERHYTMDAYNAAKRNLVAHQTKEQVAVLNYDDEAVRAWAEHTEAQICYFSRKVELEQGVFMRNGDFIIRWNGEEKKVVNIKECLLFGGHNEENILGAIGCGYFAGVSVEDMADVLRSFKSIEHRIEYVDTIKGVKYYNDSKATNTDSVIKALEAFENGHIILLAGGHDKMTPLEDMMNLVREKCDLLVLLGEAKERFNEAAMACGVKNIVIVQSFDEAVQKAYEAAKEPQVVLLSPACSSYDMFNNYPERGRKFKALVKALPH